MSGNALADNEILSSLADQDKLSIIAKNLVWDRNGLDGAKDRQDWSQAFIAKYESGYFGGEIQIGFDITGMVATKIIADDDKAGLGNLPLKSNGEIDNNYGKIAPSLKLKYDQTILRYGDLQPRTPVFAPYGTRLLPETATGFSLESTHIKYNKIDMGYFTRGTSPAGNERERLYANYAKKQADSAQYLGTTFNPNNQFLVSVYALNLENIYDQYYFSLRYTPTIQDIQPITLSSKVYRTNDAGTSDAGPIKNTAYSLSLKYSLSKTHGVTLAYQKIDGNTPLDTVAFGSGAGAKGDSVWLDNAVQYSDFNAPNEQSWQIRYDLDFSAYGIPGLSAMARYIYGSKIDGSHLDDSSAYFNKYGVNGKHHETNIEAKYIFQSGTFKDASIRLRQSWHRGNKAQSEGNVNDFRLITEIPFSIF